MVIGRRMSVLLVCLGLLVCGAAGQDVGSGVAMPGTISSVEPAYGDSVKTYGMAGAVTVYTQINKQGRATVQRAFGPLARCSDLDSPEIEKIRKAVTDAAAATVFEPPMKGGKPTEVFVNLTYRFAPPGMESTAKPDKARPTTISGGVLNGKASKLPLPTYPPAARANRVSGAATVQVLVSEKGDVLTAGTVSGHPLLQEASVEAACGAKFLPTTLSGVPVRVSGALVYNFVP